MRKEQFANYDRDVTHCDHCNHDLPTDHFYYRDIRLDGTAKYCRCCKWIIDHPDKLQFKGWCDNHIKRVIQLLVYKETSLVNDIISTLDNIYSLEQILELIKFLNIGNVPLKLSVPCAECGGEIDVYVSRYLNNKNVYCSRNCYWKSKNGMIGEKSPSYNRIKTLCTNCGKEIFVIPHNYKKTNKFGDNHNFCSQECYWQYRGKYYVGEKGAMYNHQYTDEQRSHVVNAVIKNATKRNKDTQIQLKVNKILDKLVLIHEREYIVGYYAIDNFLIDYNLAIEVMGDYWHGNPLRYNINKYKLNGIQTKTILKDKQKNTYLSNNGIQILYLWETDINKRYDTCIELVKYFIQNNGELDNYHSFNYSFQDVLQLNDTIINPYQNQRASDYRYLIDKKCLNGNPSTTTVM